MTPGRCSRGATVGSTLRVLAVALVPVLLAVGCGAPPQQQGSDGSGETAASDFRACMVTDEGGIDDRSFNTLAWRGMTDARDQLGVKVAYLESTSNSDYIPNLRQFINQQCDLIVTVGFLLGDATKKMAQQHPDQKFAIVDYSYPQPIPNVKPLVFDSSQSAFLAGYLSAGMTDSGVVAQFGGSKIPPVTLYMDGYVAGVRHYNDRHGTDVKVLGWNKAEQNGVFTGNFTDQAKGKTVTENFINQGADIIFPLAGAVNLGAAAAVEDAGDVSMIWVDADGCEAARQFCDLFISSALKRIDVAVRTAIEEAVGQSFSNEPFVGTLANKGVGLGPYHKYSDDVPKQLDQELERIKQAIIDGDIEISSPSKPQG